MPPVAIAAVAAVAAAGVGVALGTITIAAAIGSVLTTTALAGASYLLQPSAGQSSAPNNPRQAAPANVMRDVPVRQAVPPRRFVLGRVRTAGVYFFLRTDNPKLYLGQLLSDGPIEGVEAVYMGETVVPLDANGDAQEGTLWHQALTVRHTVGLAGQIADATLRTVFSLDVTFRQRGVARAVTIMDWGDDSTDHQSLWGAGISPTFTVKGVRAYDPRDAAQFPNSPNSWTYTTNPALLIAYVLTRAWDVGVPTADIDYDQIEAAADDFDATMTYEGDTVKIFELAGIFQSGHSLAAQLDDMCRSCGAAITFADGKYGLVVDKPRTSVWTITDDDVIALGQYTATGTTDETPTAVKARFFDQTQAGRQTTTPIIQDAAAVAAEGYRESLIEYGYSPRSHSAQILAYRELQRARDGRQLQITVSDAGIYLDVLDRVTVNFQHASFLNGEYSVVQVDLGENGAILSLRAYVAAAYTDPATYLV